MVNKSGQQLNIFEQYHYHRNELHVSSCFIVGLKLNVKIESESVSNAIRTLYESRLKLRLNIFKEDGKFVAKELETFSLNSIKFIENTSDQETSLNQLHETTFEFGVQKTLWKIVVVNNQWIYVLCEHTLYDGTTAALVLEDLLKILNNIDLSKDINPEETEFNQITKPSFLNLASKIIEAFAPRWVNSLAQYFQSLPSKFDDLNPGWIIEQEKKQTYYCEKHIISLSKQEFGKLKKLGTNHGVKFTSLWAHLNLIAFGEIQKENVKISIPFNVRSVLSPEHERTYGLFVSAIQLNLIPTESTVINWELCEYINRSLQKPHLLKACELIGMLNYVDPIDFLKSLISQPRSPTLEISNLGLRDAQIGGPISADEFVFSQSNNLIGASIMQSLASTTEKVNIVIGCVPEFEQYFEVFVEKLEIVLKETLDSIT